MPITASMLYDLIACPHRLSMDLFADPGDRDEISPAKERLGGRDIAPGTQPEVDRPARPVNRTI